MAVDITHYDCFNNAIIFYINLYRCVSSINPTTFPIYVYMCIYNISKNFFFFFENISRRYIYVCICMLGFLGTIITYFQVKVRELNCQFFLIAFLLSILILLYIYWDTYVYVKRRGFFCELNRPRNREVHTHIGTQIIKMKRCAINVALWTNIEFFNTAVEEKIQFHRLCNLSFPTRCSFFSKK